MDGVILEAGGGTLNRTFIKGLELGELFYREAVKPILAKHFPDLTYSAALIGLGSEVLSFDTPQSIDHDWGPKLMLFLGEADHETHHDGINQTLRQELPGEIHGYPTNFGHHKDGTTVMTATDSGPINHGVVFLTVQCFFNAQQCAATNRLGSRAVDRRQLAKDCARPTRSA